MSSYAPSSPDWEPGPKVRGAQKQTDESFEFISRDFYELYSLEIEQNWVFCFFIELD